MLVGLFSTHCIMFACFTFVSTEIGLMYSKQLVLLNFFLFLGDQNLGSPMMPQSIRSQTPVQGGMPNPMHPLPNNPAGMSQIRMSGSQMQVGGLEL
jgi:hypothetical protein